MGLGKDNSYKSKPKEIWDMIGEHLEQIEKAEMLVEVFRKIFEEVYEEDSIYKPISIKMYEYQKSKETDETKKIQILSELQTTLEKDFNYKSKTHQIWDMIGEQLEEIEKAEKPEEVFENIFAKVFGVPINIDEESIKALEKSLMDLALHYQKDSEDKEGETKLLLAFTEQLTKSGIDKSMSKTIAIK